MKINLHIVLRSSRENSINCMRRYNSYKIKISLCGSSITTLRGNRFLDNCSSFKRNVKICRKSLQYRGESIRLCSNKHKANLQRLISSKSLKHLPSAQRKNLMRLKKCMIYSIREKQAKTSRFKLRLYCINRAIQWRVYKTMISR